MEERKEISSARHLNKLLGEKDMKSSQGFKAISFLAEVIHRVHQLEIALMLLLLKSLKFSF